LIYVRIPGVETTPGLGALGSTTFLVFDFRQFVGAHVALFLRPKLLVPYSVRYPLGLFDLSFSDAYLLIHHGFFLDTPPLFRQRYSSFLLA